MSLRIALLFASFAAVLAPPAAPADPVRCLRATGATGERCLGRYLGTVERCRRIDPSGACEAAAGAPGGALEAILAEPEARIRRSCADADAFTLGFLDADDAVERVEEACRDFGEDLFAFGSGGATPPAQDLLRCQHTVTAQLRRLYRTVVPAVGRRCDAREFAGRSCDRDARDRRIASVRASAARRIETTCGADFDALALPGAGTGAALEDRIGGLLDTAAIRARHYALRVSPPNLLGPTAEFGPFPVGVKTLELADPSRSAVGGSGPRPVRTEVYYPSTPASVAGLPRDVVTLFGIRIVETPAFRDAALAPGRHPLVLFSHGNNGLRIQSFFFAAHLASHGFVVVSPDHHGNTFPDTLAGVVDPAASVNRPLDLSFLIDAFLAFDGEPGNFFEGAIDPDRIGASGHSFGGYTVFALAGGSFPLGTFTDPRVKAIFPQAPGTGAFPDSFFSSVSIPTLIVGGSLDETTPFPSSQQRPFDHLPSGAVVVGLAELVGAGHFTFSDFCEVPRNLLAFLGGFEEACEPRHLPWRHAHDIINYLSLNFFDGVLRGDPAALARLSPAALAGIEDLRYQSK